MSNSIFDIRAVGFEADQVLQRNSSVEVYGTSSSGIYLQTANDLTLFLSRESFHGPLTINLSGDHKGLDKVYPRTIVNIDGNKLVFHGAKLELSINHAEIWVPPVAPEFSGARKKILDDLYQQCKRLVGDNPFFPLLEMAFTGISVPLPGFPDFYKRMMFLKKSVQSGDVSNLTWEIENLLGVGPGLTPLGDDLILGILLALNRGKESSQAEVYLTQLNQGVIELALDKTTRLSFSLIVCAADGSADERLLNILDDLLSGTEPGDKDLMHMLTWGSTSGFAVLAGMLLALF